MVLHQYNRVYKYINDASREDSLYIYVKTYNCFEIPNGNIEDYKLVFVVRTTELLLEPECSLFVIHHLRKCERARLG